jgi:hypothetical protein
MGKMAKGSAYIYIYILLSPEILCHINRVVVRRGLVKPRKSLVRKFDVAAKY